MAIPLSIKKKKHTRKRHLRIWFRHSKVKANQTSSYTHYLSFTQKPFEVVFLDVHHAGDVRDIKVVVLHVVGLQVYLDAWKRHLNQLNGQQKHVLLRTIKRKRWQKLGWAAWLPCGVFPAASVWQQNSFRRRWAEAASCLLLVKTQQCSYICPPFW